MRKPDDKPTVDAYLAIRDIYRNHPAAALAANFNPFVARGIVPIVALQARNVGQDWMK